MSHEWMRILVVGKPFPGTNAMLERLELCGCGSQTVETLHEAQAALGTFQFAVVLCAEKLPDGRAFDLDKLVVDKAATLYIAVALSESCVWLAGVERDERALGNRALDTRTLELEILNSLGHFYGSAMRPLPQAARTAAKSPIPPRRDSALARTRGNAPGTSKAGPASSRDSEADPHGETQREHGGKSHRMRRSDRTP